MPPAGIQETQARSVPPSRERPRNPLPLPAVLQPPLALPCSFPAVPFVQQGNKDLLELLKVVLLYVTVQLKMRLTLKCLLR